MHCLWSLLGTASSHTFPHRIFPSKRASPPLPRSLSDAHYFVISIILSHCAGGKTHSGYTQLLLVLNLLGCELRTGLIRLQNRREGSLKAPKILLAVVPGGTNWSWLQRGVAWGKRAKIGRLVHVGWYVGSRALGQDPGVRSDVLHLHGDGMKRTQQLCPCLDSSGDVWTLVSRGPKSPHLPSPVSGHIWPEPLCSGNTRMPDIYRAGLKVFSFLPWPLGVKCHWKCGSCREEFQAPLVQTFLSAILFWILQMLFRSLACLE